jgi:DUF971 family protein
VTIPRDIHAESIEGVGNYAVKINWSDGHGTGLYTWETLRRVRDAVTAPPRA